MTPYFITGLPRSRTAWLANYMTYGSSACFHDLLHRFTFSEIEDKLEKTECTYIGYSDPALLLHWEAVVDLYPNARWLVITRDIEDVARTWDHVLGQDSTEQLRLYEEYIREMRATIPRLLYVAFDDIDKRLDEITGHLAPVALFPGWRKEMLCRMNIQITPKAIVEAIKESAISWEQD